MDMDGLPSHHHDRDPAVDDLRLALARRQVVVVVGAGVSVAATAEGPGAAVASWPGLLESGIARCAGFGDPPVPDGWAERRRADLASGDLGSMLAVAEEVASRLGAPGSGEFRRWLKETVGSLRPAAPAVLEALRDLGMPLATTNYDGLLEAVTGLPAVTWRQGARVEQVVRGEEDGILHLHGHWQEPESVVLGVRTYAAVAADPHGEAVLRALRTMRMFLFVGCGAGLEDPHFDALRRWSREAFGGSTYRHYRLCREGEVAGLRALHPAAERIFPLSYGAGHDGLVPFLRSLAAERAARVAAGVGAGGSVVGAARVALAAGAVTVPAGSAAAAAGTPAVVAGTVAARSATVATQVAVAGWGQVPPAPAHCFGRDEAIADVVAAVCEEPPAPVAILGPPGVGKTTVSLEALHDSRVARRFGARRLFVRCDGATSADGLLAATATALGLEPGPGLGQRVFAELGAAPAVVALDNAETPWEAETLAVEEILARLAALPGLALVASLRGEERPEGLAWREAIRLRPLPLVEARRAFLAVAGELHRGDALLDRLLVAVDGLPLAINLLAHEAEALPALEPLWQRWSAERSGLLQRAGGRSRETSLEVSVAVSLESPRLTAAGRRLASLLALLPDGAAAQDLDALCPGEAAGGAASLRRTGLVVADAPRLRLLPPIREVLSRTLAPGAEDRMRLMAHYLGLAGLGEKVGAEGGGDAVLRLAPEIGNLEALLASALEASDPEPAIAATLALAELQRFTGLGGYAVVERAVEAARRAGLESCEGRLRRRLGQLAYNRSDNDAGRRNFEEALVLFRRVGDLLGEASCIWSLGDIALVRSDLDGARSRFDEALLLCRRVGSLLGVANCTQSLGDIARQRSDHDGARAHYGEALPLYRRVGSLLGEASCIRSLGDIALARSDLDDALSRYGQALPLCRRVGDLLGEANCIRSLGNIALARSDLDSASARYDEALPLFRRVGSLLGEASCIRGLGDIARARSDLDGARARYEEALPLCRRIGDMVGEANCTRRLGDIALACSDHEGARARHEEALPLYRSGGDRLGEANCIKSLGDIAFARSDHDGARSRYDEALPLYRRTGDLLGEANCIRGLGDVALDEGRPDQALQLFAQALPLYERAARPHSIGWCHRRLARVADGEAQRRYHVEECRRVWLSIGREDLVRDLDRELADGTSFLPKINLRPE